MEIREGDLDNPAIVELLKEHLRGMFANSPPESVHALDLDALRRPEIRFWSVWDGADLLGCVALKELDPRNGEIKSMRTAAAHLRKGVAATLMQHILEVAKQRGHRRLSLETGSVAAFEPALRLYERFGFARCGPFAEYVDDPFSVFMTKVL